MFFNTFQNLVQQYRSWAWSLFRIINIYNELLTSSVVSPLALDLKELEVRLKKADARVDARAKENITSLAKEAKLDLYLSTVNDLSNIEPGY